MMLTMKRLHRSIRQFEDEALGLQSGIEADYTSTNLSQRCCLGEVHTTAATVRRGSLQAVICCDELPIKAPPTWRPKQGFLLLTAAYDTSWFTPSAPPGWFTVMS
ncbi:hypothetical protein AOLI_G00330890 [Acnodon oligacanthus]